MINIYINNTIPQGIYRDISIVKIMVANRLIKRNIGNEVVRSGYDLGEKI